MSEELTYPYFSCQYKHECILGKSTQCLLPSTAQWIFCGSSYPLNRAIEIITRTAVKVTIKGIKTCLLLAIIEASLELEGHMIDNSAQDRLLPQNGDLPSTVIRMTAVSKAATAPRD